LLGQKTLVWIRNSWRYQTQAGSLGNAGIGCSIARADSATSVLAQVADARFRSGWPAFWWGMQRPAKRAASNTWWEPTIGRVYALTLDKANIESHRSVNCGTSVVNDVTHLSGVNGCPLTGRVVAVTGAARGIGRATVEALVGAGADVAIGDIDAALARAVAEEIGGARAYRVDVSDESDFERFLDAVEQDLGPIDVLVNNAGIMPAGPIENEDPRLSERVVAVNLLGVIHGTKHAIRRMKPRRQGHIINMCSATARVPGAGVASYSATKAGVLGFSEAVAQELAGSGVHISVLLPSLVVTEITEGIPVRRGTPVCQPADVAQGVLSVIRRPRFQLAIPRTAGIVMAIVQALPANVRLALFHAAKTDQIIGGIDHAAHASYEARLRAAVADTAAPRTRHDWQR
jgi:NAD(P)-dependent dehydrogenase (short-subunit alcohol dehydrogenase family)